MFNRELKPEHIIQEHHEICPDIYKSFDMNMVPDRYREAPGPKSRLANVLSKREKQILKDPHDQELLRQWTMSGDPIADAFAAKFHEIGHQQAMQMLETALNEGIDQVENPAPELINLIQHVENTPEWVDWDVIDNTVEAFSPLIQSISQTGWRAGFVLTFGNSYQGLPMVLTGALHKPETTPGRIKETMSMMYYLSVPDGLRRNGDVFKTIIKVRVMHALVRVNLLRSPQRWDIKTYGVPIPMTDMYGTLAILAPALQALQKYKGKELDMNALSYLMWLFGIDERLPYSNISELGNVNNLLLATLNHRYEPWASELTAASLNAYLRPTHNTFDQFVDRADRQLSELVIQFMMGKRAAAEIGVTPGLESYFGAAVMLLPIIARYSVYKTIELFPGGKKYVRNICTENAYKMLGVVKPKYETNPEVYRNVEDRAA
jgi:hypothetical protein